jgi:hypothetical protein
MFETIDDNIKKQTDLKTTYVKAGMFVLAMGALWLIIYFFAFTGGAHI